MLLRLTSGLLLAAAPLLATNIAGEPTDITNWPACAQKCIPQGFGPPADCGSLSNLTCICEQGTFTAQIAECEQLGCSSQERQDITTLSDRLCAPVGGFGTSLLATVSAIVTSFSISTTPTVPASVTGITEVSSVLATATPAPNLGNPANILSYPLCAQICSNESLAIGQSVGTIYGGTGDLSVLCGPRFRSATAGCEAATCDVTDYETTSLLSQQLCGSLYDNNATLSSSVSSAIASATAAAKAATEGKDPTDLANYPSCAQTCIPQNNYNGCGSINNLECVCQGIQFNNAINPCETSLCTPADLQTVVFLAEKLCIPAGGVLTNPVNYTGSGSNFTNGSTVPIPFTGEAIKVYGGGVMVATGSIALAVALGLVML